MAKEPDKTDEITIKKEWGEVAERFIKELVKDDYFGNYTIAAKQAGVARPYIYELFAKFPDFEALCKSIRISKRAFKADVAENKLMKLVELGVPSAVIFTLKKNNPEEYGDKGTDDGAGPLALTHTFSPELEETVKRLTEKYANDKK